MPPKSNLNDACAELALSLHGAHREGLEFLCRLHDVPYANARNKGVLTVRLAKKLLGVAAEKASAASSGRPEASGATSSEENNEAEEENNEAAEENNEAEDKSDEASEEEEEEENKA